MTEPIEPPRDAEGKIDVQGTMQVITDVVEGWVREHPSNGCGCTAAGGRTQPPRGSQGVQRFGRSVPPSLPVLILVHSRFISRCVLWSRAVMV